MSELVQSGQWAEKDNAASLMKTTLQHYATHRKVVLRKLALAQKAAAAHSKEQSLSEAKGFLGKMKAKIAPEETEVNPLWSEITLLFSVKTIYEDDLFYIEELLAKMPAAMKTHFQSICSDDKELRELTNELDHDGYRAAKERITEVQKFENPITGLGPDDYEDSLLQHLKTLLFGEF